MSSATHGAPLRTVSCNRRPMFHRIFAADPQTVRMALLFMRERFHGSTEAEVIGRLELALAEVLNNICKHGVRERALHPDGSAQMPMIHLCVIRHVGGIACAVTDDGAALPDACLGPRSLPAHDDTWNLASLPESGFGWYLIQELTASLSYFREGPRNFLGFIIPLSQQDTDTDTAEVQFRPN